jgi:nitric oxide reductase NorE protein
MLGRLDSSPSIEGGSHLPGDFSMWVFVLGDMAFFAAYYAIFMVYRVHEPGLFLESQRHLSVTIGAINTLVLLTSSRFVALGVQATRRGDRGRARRLIYTGAVCGGLFVLIKIYEWHSEVSRGFTLSRNDFFMFYYMLTGVHLFHVLLGMGILAFALWELRQAEEYRSWVVEAAATFWHMVDLLWVVLFALIYVMR